MAPASVPSPLRASRGDAVRSRSRRRHRDRARHRWVRRCVLPVVVPAALLVSSCAGSSASGSPSTVASPSTTIASSPVCDALLTAADAVLAGGSGGDWSSMVATLDSVTPMVPEALRSDWKVVVDRLTAMSSSAGNGSFDLTDPAAMQRVAQMLTNATDPALARALGAIEDYVGRQCPP